jgi:serine/threonine protein kinase
MLAKNPAQRITSGEALNHPALTVVLSQSPLHVRSVFDNKDLMQYNQITDQYDPKQIRTKKKVKKSFPEIPDKIEDMSPVPTGTRKKDRDGNPSKPAKQPPADHTPSSNSKAQPNVFGEND